MSQFEFMRNLPVGQYLPITSFIHEMDPRARLTGFTLIFLGLTFSNTLLGLSVGLLMLIAILAAANIPVRYALKAMAGPIPFIFILAALQVLWNSGGDSGALILSWQSFTLSWLDIQIGMVLLIRFCGLILSLETLSYTTSTQQLTQGLNGILAPLKRIRIEVDDFVMMVQITLRFLPLLAQSAERIAKAQASRGADWGTPSSSIVVRVRRVLPILMPLFITSLNRANYMALAMDARAYGASARSSQIILKMRPRDWLGMVVSILTTLIIILFQV